MTWRTEREIRGVQAMLQRDLTLCANGATCEVDYGTMKAAIEIMLQTRTMVQAVEEFNAHLGQLKEQKA